MTRPPGWSDARPRATWCCTFSLDSWPSSFAALKMSWVPWKRQGQWGRWKKGGEKGAVVIIMTIKGSSKQLSVTQKTATFLTHSFTVTLSWFTDVKVLFPSSADITLIWVLFVPKNLSLSLSHRHSHTHIEWDTSVREENDSARIKANRKNFSCPRQHARTRTCTQQQVAWWHTGVIPHNHSRLMEYFDK